MLCSFVLYPTLRKFEVVYSVRRISKFFQLFHKSIGVRRPFTLIGQQNLLALLRMSSTESKKLKTDMKELTIGTHSGTFHCDEVLGCFMLQQLDKYKDAKIVRSRDAAILKNCDIVIDVGHIFNPDENLFDHHQNSFSETLSTLRPELQENYNIRLSSAGLIYTFFGEQVIANILKTQANIELNSNKIMLLYKKVYETFIQEIDAIDNGVQICDGEPYYNITTHLSNRVAELNPSWNDASTDVDVNVRFEKAKELVGSELIKKILHFATVWLPGRDIVARAIKNAKSIHDSGEIVELEQFCPWNSHLINIEKEYNMQGKLKYVLFQDRGNDWRVQCVPNAPNSFICRKFLHKNWRGLSADKIHQISGINDVVFCHSTGFIGGASSRDGALKMAIQSLDGDYID